MKKYFSLISLLTILFCGCNQEELVNNQSTTSESRTFTASFEQNESRTYLELGKLLRWTAGDQISLFEGNALNRQYQFDGETGDNAGTFSYVAKPFGTGSDLTAHYAVYPYSSNIKITEEGVITATLPAEQSYAENSFGVGNNTMVAVTKDTDDTFLKFKNVGGFLKFQLYGDNVTIKTITLTGNNKEKLSGKAIITPVYGEDPTISMTEEATETITLDCGEGVKIGTTSETTTAFWVVIPPTTFEKGFTLTVTDINGGEFTKTTSNAISVERNVIKPMAALEVSILDKELEGEGGDLIPYLTFTAEAGQSLTMSQAIETLEYSVNDGDWTTLGTTTVYFGGELGALKLRGKSKYGTSNATVKFGNAALVSCSGDIRTLVDYENYNTADTQEAIYKNLFKNCSSLVSAPELPATTLENNCYYQMFYKCTNLVTAPKLPATTLAYACYYSMFEGCTSLTNAPELPANILASNCYSQMFKGCTSLRTAPELPAKTLTELCYSFMFENCTSLNSAPELPATTLGKNCYYAIFKGCTSLTNSPKLPATQLAEYCYRDMFNGCTSLINAPELPATTLAWGCYYYMFNNCTNLTTAPELLASELVEWCYCNMFSGCTSLTTAPELPAATMKDRCYNSMFSDCNSLTNAPELPATTLAESCYDSMFFGCASITTAPKLPAKILARACYWQMFSSCTSLTTAPELPATILAESCYGYMFQNCTSLVTVPELPATILAEDCYYGMFNRCTSLTKAPELPATTLAVECYDGMFYNCSSLTTAPELPATTLADYCYKKMFYGCSNLTNAPELRAATLTKECYREMFYNCKKIDSILMLATDISAAYALTSWVAGVSSTGTFIKAPEMESLSRGIYGIPNGWTVINYGEE